MTTTGWPIITTPISALPLILANTTSPATGQSLIYSGTQFANAGFSTLTSLTTFTINTTASAVSTITTANTPVAFTNTSGTITLATGTYMFLFNGYCTYIKYEYRKY